MNVLVIAPEWPPHVIGGGGAVYKTIATFLRDRGHAVTVAHGDHTNEDFSSPAEIATAEGISIVRLPLVPTPPAMSWLSSALPPTPKALSFLSRLAKQRWDVAHLHGAGFPLIDYAAYALRRARVPYAYTIHGVPNSPLFRGSLIGASLRVYLRLATQRTVGGAAYVTCVSRSLMQNELLDLRRAQVIYNGIATVRNGIVGDERTPRSPLRLLSACRLTLNKGLDVAIRAVALLKSRSISCVYDIWGPDGGEGPSLRLLCEELGIADSVRFMGTFAPSMSAAVFEDADVMLIPSRVEAFGLAAIESLANGLPLIASRVDGLAEILRPEACALVEPGNVVALAEAIIEAGRADRRREMIREGYKLASEFLWDRILPQYENVLQRCAEGPRSQC